MGALWVDGNVQMNSEFIATSCHYFFKYLILIYRCFAVIVHLSKMRWEENWGADISCFRPLLEQKLLLSLYIVPSVYIMCIFLVCRCATWVLIPFMN